MVLAAELSVSSGRSGGETRPVSRLVRDRPASVATPQKLTVVTANIWKANPALLSDVAHLVAQRADVIGLNEARGLRSELRSVPGYRLVLPAGGRAGTANPILLRRATTRFLGSGSELMCEAVGSSPERWAVYALFEHHGARTAYVNTHMNSHVDNDGVPYPLPRVGRYVEHTTRLAALVHGLRARDYDVLVGGDLNWAWSDGAEQWEHAPASVFDRLGLEPNWAQRGAPMGGTFEDRRIDYVAHDPAQLRVVRQRLLHGHSDHVWPMVTYRPWAPVAEAPPRMTRTGGGD